MEYDGTNLSATIGGDPPVAEVRPKVDLGRMSRADVNRLIEDLMVVSSRMLPGLYHMASAEPE